MRFMHSKDSRCLPRSLSVSALFLSPNSSSGSSSKDLFRQTRDSSNLFKSLSVSPFPLSAVACNGSISNTLRKGLDSFEERSTCLKIVVTQEGLLTSIQSLLSLSRQLHFLEMNINSKGIISLLGSACVTLQ